MIALQKFTPVNFARLKSWVASEALLIQFAGPIFHYPLTDEQLLAYLANPNRHPFTVMYHGRPIGHAEVTLLENNSARLCRILIGETENRGKGLGEQIIRALVALCWNHFHVQEIELNVYEWNTGAIRCYEKAGFAKRAMFSGDEDSSEIIKMVLTR
uniref:GNAT family N-acetyltransferase n=1 Tax=Roseihalotalea indica TaxID=2867963 RepID=A0AA49GMK5_9BACT|nr:GNAT family N-acetyltransferase [Tunicatimonas sp. TK19036]